MRRRLGESDGRRRHTEEIPMKLTLPASIAVAAAVLLSTAACSKQHELTFEVTGTDSTATQVRYDKPDGEEGNDWTTTKDAKLPFKETESSEFGLVTVEAVPKSGALTCRIVADGKEIKKVEGEPGKPVTCKTVLND
jgi:hypothetical protein